MTTQNIEEAEMISDKVCIIKNGSVLSFSTVEKIKNEYCYKIRIDFYFQRMSYSSHYQYTGRDMTEYITGKIPEALLIASSDSNMRWSYVVPVG